MSGWRIHPEEIGGVLTAMGSVQASLAASVDTMPAQGEVVIAASGECAIIADALVGFFEHHGPTLQAMGTRINNAVSGVASAVTWYVHGDEEMALDQQASAAQVAGTTAWTPELPPETQG